MRRVNIKKVNLAYYYGALKPRTITDMVVVHHTGNPTDDDLSDGHVSATTTLSARMAASKRGARIGQSALMHTERTIIR